MQQEIVRTLKQIDIDIREFTKCLECATSEKNLDEQRQWEKKLGDLKTALKAHRSQIRAWTSRFSANLPSKEKLGAARSHIEQELRRCQDFEKKSKFAAASERASKRLQSGKNSVTPTNDSKSPGLPIVEELFDSELKIMSDQLCAEDVEEMQIAKEFVCQICFHVVGKTPQLSSCSHLFCGDCVAKWIEVQPGNQSWARRASLGGAVPCPICKEPLQKDTDLHAVSPDSDGNAAILWQMLCGVKVMCANHSRCNSEGNCNWIGDYGSYQQHIHRCANTPLAEFEKETSNRAEIPNPTPEITTTADYVKIEENAFEVETTASELSEHVDTESACESEHTCSESNSDSEHAISTTHPQDFSPSCDRVSYPSSRSGFEEHDVEAHEFEEAPLTDPIADLSHLQAEEACHAQEFAKEVNADETTPLAAAQESYADHFTLNADAVPFEPAKTKEARPKRTSKKSVTQDIYSCTALHLQAAAMQYQTAHAQMTQMAYVHQLRSAQMAHYQAACIQAHMNHMRLARRCARQP